ncbi:MAG TPA: 50S ribosomal protein L11 methyltransferase [Abditibacteriaceae bacterium]|jgi:ribosomal protein L11 methyltransferase
MTEKWTELRARVTTEDSELAAYWMMESGCDGVQIDDTQLHFDASEDATFETKGTADVRSFVLEADAAEIAEKIKAALAEADIKAEIEMLLVKEEDWETSWRQNFPILDIGPFRIVPSWEESEDGGQIPLRLDPGLAFGTGQHPTTFMCLELLGENVRADSHVFDVGCGSGILAIAARKLGATRVVASDLDPFCVSASEENARENGVEIEVHERAGAAWTKEKFNLVVANLMSDLLIRLAPELRAATEDGGTLIVSGISSPRADDVEAALVAAGFKREEKRERDGDFKPEGNADYRERWAAFRFST